MKKLLLAVTLLAGFTQAAYAGSVEQQVISSLRAQGYQVLEQGYTFLGRLRIVAQNGSFQREILVNPGTGEVLHDVAVSLQHRDGNETAQPELVLDDVSPETEAPDDLGTDVVGAESQTDFPPTDDTVAPDPNVQVDDEPGEVIAPDFVFTETDQSAIEQPIDATLP
jgi:hypothetical protein